LIRRSLAKPRALISALSVGMLALAPSSFAAPTPPEPPPPVLVEHFPPPAALDQQHVKLEVAWPDPSSKSVTIRETLDLRTTAAAKDILELDALGMSIRSARADGHPIPFQHDGSTLRLTPPRPLAPGAKLRLEFEFDVPLTSEIKFGGLVRREPKPDADTDSDRSPLIYSQGESELNRRWIICEDFPSDRMTSEVIAATPDGYTAISNGRLLSSDRASDGLTRWHWTQDKPHVSYLITLVIGKFDRADLGGPASARPGLDMPLFAPVGKAPLAAEVFAKTPAMVAFFERTFDEPYPWDKYAQVIVTDFEGGMENTSATTMMSSLLDTRRDDADDYISHELAHQWFGDLVTCKSWEHIWLNEGWATYCEALWREEAARLNHEDPRAAYLTLVRRWLDDQSEHNKASAPADAAMASKLYPAGNADYIFEKPDDPYDKGGLILHMLSEMLGRDALLAGARAYLNQHKLGLAETSDLRRALEAASGKSLSAFFDRWVFRPGIPRLAVGVSPQGDRVHVAVEQTQTIDAHNPPYEFDLPILLHLENGKVQGIRIPIRGPTSQSDFPLAGVIASVEIDPDITVAAARTLRSGPGAASHDPVAKDHDETGR
jgi:aminopeptidase N